MWSRSISSNSLWSREVRGEMMCLVLDTSVLTAVASFFLAVSLKDEISCPVITTMVLVIQKKK